MTITPIVRVVLASFVVAVPSAANVMAQGTPTSIAAKTTGFERRDGFLPIYVNAKSCDPFGIPEN